MASVEKGKGRVCVTGAAGFVASWLVKLLLSKGYVVHGTARVRQPEDEEKYGHLTKLEKASDNLKLFKADLLDYDSMFSAIKGCHGVFHVATAMPSTAISNPEIELVEPAVKGTLNVVKACVEAKVKRLVLVSSIVAVGRNPNWPKGQVMDETCWSDKEHCKSIKDWYAVSKTQAESEATEYAKRSGLELITVCPGLILGPILQSYANASTLVLLKHFKGGSDCVENTKWMMVDVRDVAEALLLGYEKAEAQGRYICTAHDINTHDLVDKLRSIYPHNDYPNKFVDVEEEINLSSGKLQRLGWRYRSLDETLVDSLKSYQHAGLLD
ncbi:cinnamoyl-CoA reductase 1 isoform X1 [Ziziphus jujuba]|uniref:Cinnamoyl-CoA reductase 1 isoform X1 n=1 Tax=Ziziphus jujuba TaxID=326968 RepID=A0ABM4AAB7_ZIZJJ|nr:cinnamoyl-CoA reductase 1 isoform X1 [Ziziphus jujuba]